MSQLVCPLCGRFVSLSRFDPSFFESDIFAVNVRGLGRGKGFAVSETFSVLGERAVTDPIADRCRVILGVIEGREVLSGDEGAVLRAEVERWKREAQRERLVGEELFAKLVELEERNSLWRGEVSRLRSQLEERAAELALMEEEALRWKGVASELRAEVDGLRFELAEADEEEDEDDDEYDEEEMLASEEMQEILDRINASANADFEYLSDAVDFLLEGG